MKFDGDTLFFLGMLFLGLFAISIPIAGLIGIPKINEAKDNGTYYLLWEKYFTECMKMRNIYNISNQTLQTIQADCRDYANEKTDKFFYPFPLNVLP